MTLFQKDPDATLDYKRDWSDWLTPFGDTIQTSTWTVSTGLTKSNESNTATVATVWLSGGTVGASYTVTNHIVTAQGRTDERSFQVNVRQR